MRFFRILQITGFLLSIISFVMIGLTINDSLNQSDHLNNLIIVKQKIQHNMENTKQLSYKQYKQKLKNHLFVAYQKVYYPSKNQYYAIFYNKNHKEYTIPMMSYHIINFKNKNKNNIAYYKNLKFYNKLAQPPQFNGQQSAKEKETGYKNWFCGNQKAIQNFLGLKTFYNLKVEQNNICHNS